MRKYHCLGALFISLLLCACSDAAGTTDKTDMELQNPTEPVQQESLSEEILFHSPKTERRTRELLEKPEGATTNLVWNAEEQKFENDIRLNQISLADFDQEKQ